MRLRGALVALCAAVTSPVLAIPEGNVFTNRNLTTPWSAAARENPWPEYPRPRLQRSLWKNLNGAWGWSSTDAKGLGNPPFGKQLEREVRVPYCLESNLSGIVYENNYTYIYSWYRTNLDIPSGWPKHNRVLLNFGAVDYQSTVFVNGKNVGNHTGGYTEFSFDITEHLHRKGKNELLVHVYDPTDLDRIQIPIGKQTLGRDGMIWYTACSGIWQTVWLESTPSDYVKKLDLTANADGQVNVTVHSSSGTPSPFEISIHTAGSKHVKSKVQGTTDSPFLFKVDSPDLWSPESPSLYDITIRFGDDKIHSYTGFRTIESGIVNGVRRFLLNGKFTFTFGPLDQGWWPDGIMSPPTLEGMKYDLQIIKKLGMNAVRKHIKVEPALWYKAADEIGLLVIQDMVSLRPDLPDPANPNNIIRLEGEAEHQEWVRQFVLMVEQLKSYPSIFAWTIYNEEWGQDLNTKPFREFEIAEMIRSLDPTRLINAVSGWTDHGAGNYHDNHHYSTPQCGVPEGNYDASRIALQGEFGGIGQYTEQEHAWFPKQYQTSYETVNTLDEWNFKIHDLLVQLHNHTANYSCSGGIYTQVTDAEGEVNGLMTFDRRILRTNITQWKADIQALYDAAEERGKSTENKGKKGTGRVLVIVDKNGGLALQREIA